jgi:hypothetical protein
MLLKALLRFSSTWTSSYFKRLITRLLLLTEESMLGGFWYFQWYPFHQALELHFGAWFWAYLSWYKSVYHLFVNQCPWHRLLQRHLMSSCLLAFWVSVPRIQLNDKKVPFLPVSIIHNLSRYAGVNLVTASPLAVCHPSTLTFRTRALGLYSNKAVITQLTSTKCCTGSYFISVDPKHILQISDLPNLMSFPPWICCLNNSVYSVDLLCTVLALFLLISCNNCINCVSGKCYCLQIGRMHPTEPSMNVPFWHTFTQESTKHVQ